MPDSRLPELETVANSLRDAKTYEQWEVNRRRGLRQAATGLIFLAAILLMLGNTWQSWPIVIFFGLVLSAFFLIGQSQRRWETVFPDGPGRHAPRSNGLLRGLTVTGFVLWLVAAAFVPYVGPVLLSVSFLAAMLACSWAKWPADHPLSIAFLAVSPSGFLLVQGRLPPPATLALFVLALGLAYLTIGVMRSLQRPRWSS